MGLSEKIAMDMLGYQKPLDKSDIGFITTVLRDNTVDDRMYYYYSLVLEVLMKKEEQ